jgi:hypothetical protein
MTLEQLMKLFEERVQNRFFGKYAGVVTDVKDPLEIGRIRAKVPAVLGEEVETGWALPCAPFGGGKDRGFLMLPEVGDTVWMEFAAGDVSQPIWVGAFWGAPDSAGQQDDLAQEAGSEVPTAEDAKAGPGRHVLRTAAGHRLLLDDEGDIVLTHGGDKVELRLTKEGSVDIRGAKAEVHLTKDGEVVLKGAKAELHITQQGEVVIKAEKIKLEDNKDEVKKPSEPLVLGRAFMELFNKHTHPTPSGASFPPEPLSVMTEAHLSQTSFTE